MSSENSDVNTKQEPRCLTDLMSVRQSENMLLFRLELLWEERIIIKQSERVTVSSEGERPGTETMAGTQGTETKGMNSDLWVQTCQ